MTGANGTADKVQDVVKDLGEIGRELRDKANEVRKDAVKTLNSAAETIRREARENSQETDLHKTADEVAKGLEKAAHYLNHHPVEEMGKQATKVVRNNPMQIAIVALIIGLVLGLMLRGGDRN